MLAVADAGGTHSAADARSVKPRRVLPRLVTLIVTVLVLGGALYAIMMWRDARLAAAAAMSSYEMPPMEVPAMTVVSQDMENAIRTVGSLAAMQQVTLAPEIGGRVSQVLFEPGQLVEEGAPLVRLNDATEEAELVSARAHELYTGLQLERSQQLAPAGTESRQTLQQRELEHQQAQAAVDLIEARIQQKTILAPFTGRLDLSQLNEGTYVSPGEAITQLTAVDRLHLNFNVPQQDLPKLTVGGVVNVTTDVFGDQVFAAVISGISPSISAETRNVSVQAVVDNADGQLRPGLFVNVAVALPSTPDTILVPDTAITSSASGDVAYLVRDGVAAIVPVTVGSRSNGQLQITSGLADGDTLITFGQLRVRPGGPVVVADPNAPPSTNAW